MYTLTNFELIDSLKKARESGIKIFAIFDEQQLLNHNKIILELNNVDINFKTNGKSNARMHHKFLVIDGETTITGSFNWTYQANKANYENIIMIRDPSISIKYESEFNRIWEFITSQSIENIIEKQHMKVINKKTKEPKREKEEMAEDLYQRALRNTDYSVNSVAVHNMEAASKLGHTMAKEWLKKWAY